MLAVTSFCRLLTRPERHPRLAFPGCGAPSRPRIPTDRSGAPAVPRRPEGQPGTFYSRARCDPRSPAIVRRRSRPSARSRAAASINRYHPVTDQGSQSMHDTARERTDARAAGPSARAATPGDGAAIARIYSEGIEDRIATFETRPRMASDVAAWFDGRHPIVVVGDPDGNVVGFAATFEYRPRACYAGVAEFSVYVARTFRATGDRPARDGERSSRRPRRPACGSSCRASSWRTSRAAGSSSTSGSARSASTAVTACSTADGGTW